MNLQQQTQNVAAQGRYGDSMLMHVNPAEVAGLSQVMPLTVNPETGQPEAFLPFLLPLLGSLGGTALAGTAAGMGLSGAALGAIGGGLGTWAATGDIKKGILGGLTGYGLGSVLGAGKTAAQAAQGTAATAAANAAATSPIAGGTQFVANQALSNVGRTAAEQAAVGGSGLSAGLSAAGTQLMQPSSYIPLGVGLGGLGTMQSQEQFQQAMANLKNNDTEEYNRILAEHPEYVPMLQQNQTYQGFAQGGAAKLKKEFKPTAAIQARDIDPYFMAGLQGERGYLKNVNPSSGQIISGKSGYDFGTEMADAPMSAPFNPTETIGYQSFYNAPREPYMLDPYAKQTFEAPPPPSAPPPRIVEPVREEPQLPVATLPVPPPEESTIVTPAANPYNIPDDMYGNIDTLEDKYGISAEDLLDINNFNPSGSNPYTFNPSGFNPASYNPPSFDPSPFNPSTFNPSTFDPSTVGLSREEIESGSFDPSMLEAPPPMVIPEEVIEPAFQPFGGRGGSNNPFDIPSDDVFEDTSDVTEPQERGFFGLGEKGVASNSLFSGPKEALTRPIKGGRGGRGGRARKAAGGLTQEGYLEGVGQGISDQFSFGGEEEGSLSLISELLQGNITPEAKARRKEMEDVPSFGYKGGDFERISDVISNSSQDVADDMTKENMMTDPITQEVVLFILGESENEQAVEQFISKYGNEAFMQLRNSVLQSITNPDVQTEGLIEGTGQGGMSDDINGTLGNQEKIAVSQDEFIVPADVVSGIGDGSSNSGAEELYAMMDRVRQAKTGTTQQAPRLANAGGYLPA